MRSSGSDGAHILCELSLGLASSSIFMARQHDKTYPEAMPQRDTPKQKCSRAKTTGVRNTSLAKEIVMKTLAIIDNLNPAYIILDNTPKLDFSKTNHFGKSLNVVSYV